MLSFNHNLIFLDVVETKMMIILRHTSMNQWRWLQVFMMFQIKSMLPFFILGNTSFTDILCYFVDLRHQLTILKCKLVKCTVSTR